jgi:hypothetical protein
VEQAESQAEKSRELAPCIPAVEGAVSLEIMEGQSASHDIVLSPK